MSFTAVYRDGARGTVKHPQVDTGLGFTCDEGILSVVMAFVDAGIDTHSSCQADCTWMVPRMRLGFRCATPEETFAICLHLRRELYDATGWSQELHLDTYYRDGEIVAEPFASLSFVPELESAVIAAVGGLRG